MPQIVDLKEINKKEIINKIKSGEIFIYPTDSVYSLGCNALKAASVEQIKKINKKENKPLSVIVPSKEWIYKNLKVHNKSYIQKLPGPFTFILEVKKRATARNVNHGYKTLGVRLPNHPFSELIKTANVPFITTSLNINNKIVRNIEQTPNYVRKKVDIIINNGYLPNYQTTIIDLTENIPKIISRRYN